MVYICRYDIVCRVWHDVLSFYDTYDITLDIIDSLIFLIYSDDILRVCVMRKSINLHSKSTFSCVVKGVISIATSTYILLLVQALISFPVETRNRILPYWLVD